MKVIDEFIQNKLNPDKKEEGHLKDFLYSNKLKKNIPYFEWNLENTYADQTQIFKSYQRKRKN